MDIQTINNYFCKVLDINACNSNVQDFLLIHLLFFRVNDPKEWTVSFGLLLSDPQIQRTVKDIIIHENYHYPAHDNDIAVVHLSSPVLYTSKIRRACLPEATYKFPHNSKVVVTGWGTLKSDGELLISLYHTV